MSSICHNTVSGEKLVKYIERLEAKNKTIDALKEDVKVIKAEARAEGFDPKGIAFCVKVRKKSPSEFREEEDQRDLYLHAIGMAPTPPLFKHLEGLAGNVFAEAELIEHMKALVPTGGALTVQLAGGKPMKITRDGDGKVTVEEVKPAPVHPKPGPSAAPDLPAAEPPPAVDADGAEQLGRDAAKADRPIIANPFPFGDERRARWDLGWRRETGSDGMGSDEEDDD